MTHRSFHPRPQQFTYSYSMMSYFLTQRISSLAHSKLSKTCKYFFEKNPVIVVDTVDFQSSNILITKKGWDCYKSLTNTFEDLKCQLWITSTLHFSDKDVWASILPKIYRHENVFILFPNQKIYLTLIFGIL